jgi:hypothetical protein
MPISQACHKVISETEGNVMEFLREHIMIREYLRVLGRPSVRMDYNGERVLSAIEAGIGQEDAAILKDEYNDSVRQDVGDVMNRDKGKQFVSYLMDWYRKVNHPYPGFDHGLCRFIWKDYACFCNGAAHAFAAGQLDGYLKQFETTTNPNISSKGKLDVKPTTCDPAVMADPFYSKVAGSTSRKAPPWWVWVGVLGVVGAVVISVDKKGK